MHIDVVHQVRKKTEEDTGVSTTTSTIFSHLNLSWLSICLFCSSSLLSYFSLLPAMKVETVTLKKYVYIIALLHSVTVSSANL